VNDVTRQLLVSALTAFAAVVLVLLARWKEKRESPASPPCAHEWDVRVKIVAAPIEMVGDGRMSRESVQKMYAMIERLNTGRTSVLLTCRKCGSVTERIFSGVPNE
jgi:hypothetical protein